MGNRDSLTVMTYNLHGCVGTDRRYDPRRNLSVIERVRPDILALQEVRRDRGADLDIVEELGRVYPGYTVLFLKTLVDDRGEYGNALMSRFPLMGHIDVDLDEDDHVAAATGPSRDGGSDCDEVQNTKKIAEARRAIFVKVDVSGLSVWVVATHLGVERWARRVQARRLVAAVHRHIDVRREAALLMGDINEWRRPDTFIRHLDRLFSRHVTRRTFPSRFPLLSLDRLWMTDGFERRRVWAPRSHPARTASDHLPLCATLAMPLVG